MMEAKLAKTGLAKTGLVMKRFALAGSVLALALASGSLTASAQKAAAPAAPAPAAAGAAPAAEQQSAWVKLCEKAILKKDDKDQTFDICLTHHERLDGNSGMVIVSAALREVGGSDKKHLMVMVPLGVALPAGLQVKIDDEKEPLKLQYTICHPGGCTAEIEATPELLAKMKAGKQMLVAALNIAAKPIVLPVPLTGFETTLAGKPIDPKVYGEARQELMGQIYQRQVELMKKAEDEAAKGGAPQAAAAAGAPATTGSTNKAPAAAAAAPAPKK